MRGVSQSTLAFLNSPIPSFGELPERDVTTLTAAEHMLRLRGAAPPISNRVSNPDTSSTWQPRESRVGTDTDSGQSGEHRRAGPRAAGKQRAEGLLACQLGLMWNIRRRCICCRTSRPASSRARARPAVVLGVRGVPREGVLRPSQDTLFRSGRDDSPGARPSCKT